MFTGIVEETGRIEAMEETPGGCKVAISAPKIGRDVAIGDSVAVDGCCVTVVKVDGVTLWFDLLAETMRLTVFGSRRVGDRVNLEGSLRFNGKIGGHFVTGHIDGVGKASVFEARGADSYLRLAVEPEWSRYLIYKGSVAINGVSLTVAEVFDDGLAVWLIPHTLEVTNLGQLKAGDPLNLEFDLLGKYVERLMEFGTLNR